MGFHGVLQERKSGKQPARCRGLYHESHVDFGIVEEYRGDLKGGGNTLGCACHAGEQESCVSRLAWNAEGETHQTRGRLASTDTCGTTSGEDCCGENARWQMRDVHILNLLCSWEALLTNHSVLSFRTQC